MFTSQNYIWSWCQTPPAILFQFIFWLFKKDTANSSHVGLTHALDFFLGVACQSACLTVFTWSQQLNLASTATVKHDPAQPVFLLWWLETVCSLWGQEAAKQKQRLCALQVLLSRVGPHVAVAVGSVHSLNHLLWSVVLFFFFNVFLCNGIFVVSIDWLKKSQIQRYAKHMSQPG